MNGRPALTRRGFLAATALGGLALAGCGQRVDTGRVASGPADAIAAAEAARPHTGRTVAVRLTAGSAAVDLGGTRAQAYAYNQMLPGPVIRANVGDELAVTLVNGLPHASSVHWHGLALRNDMDGAARRRRMSRRGRSSPTASSRRTRVPTGRIRIPIWMPTRGCTCR